MILGPSASATPATDVSVGGYAYACAVTSTGAVRCWGDNQHGQLGDGTTTDRGVPVTVSGSGSRVVVKIGVRSTAEIVKVEKQLVRVSSTNDIGELDAVRAKVTVIS